MAVFTDLSDEDRETITESYGINSLSSLIGIADGDRETTYLFRCKDRDLIVTLFENGAEPSDLERAFETMETLHAKGVPCPQPVRSLQGSATVRAAGRLVAIVTFVPGSSTVQPGTLKCHSLGMTMAEIHSILLPKSKRFQSDLPMGAVHGALAHQNVFFLGDKVSGVINFRLRHHDALIAEIADVLVGWAGKSNGSLDTDKSYALLAGYQSVRALLQTEQAALPAFVMAAAARHHGAGGRQELLPDLAVNAYLSTVEIIKTGLIGFNPQ